MSVHPAGRALVCDSPKCGERAVTSVSVLPNASVAMVRPLTPGAPGNRYCIWCAHAAVDRMLLNARPATPQIGDPLS